MTRSAVVLLVGLVLSVWLSPRGADGIPVTVMSVIDEMRNDKEVCQAGKLFLDSEFVKPCEKTKFPSGNLSLNQSDPAQILCLAFYDRTVRLCYLDSLGGSSTSTLPNRTSQFDSDVKKNIPVDDINGTTQFCSNWTVKYPPKYEKTRAYIMQLHENLKNPLMCMKICIGNDARFITMCSVLATMDRLSNRTDTKQYKVEETQEAQPVVLVQVVQPQLDAAGQKVKAETTVSIDPPLQVDSQKAENLPVNLPDASSKELGEETSKTGANLERQQQESTSSASSPTMKAKQPDAEAKKQQDNSGTYANSQMPAVKSPEKNVGNDEQREKAKPEKEQEVEKQTVETAQKMKSTDLGGNTETTDPLKPTIDAANPPQNQGTSGEDITDAVGSVIDDQKLGVISQHTQDDPEDQFGDGEPVEALGETDLEDYLDNLTKPPSPDEDVDQNSFQLSEKREYVPRMPSIPNEDDSHFFGYFMVFGVMCIAGYVGCHNKQKILAMVLEGRRSRGGRNRRRPSTANYRKLDCTLEEAVTSQCNSNVTHVIY